VKKMKKNRRDEGITLVALVVTIVVLLMLAAVSINMILGSNGIINKSKEAREKYAESSQNDLIGMNNLTDEIEKTLMPLNDETSPYLPDSTFKIVEGSISTGLVIEDGNGNQYVWVVVPRSLYNNTNYNSNNDKKPISSEDYNNIEYCLHEYTMMFRNDANGTETTYTDIWASDNSNNEWYTENEYVALKQKMLKSIYENGGFYVGRYETGIDSEKELPRSYGDDCLTLHETTQNPVIKANSYPYTWVRRTQAQTLSRKFIYGKYSGNLLFGVQWDLIQAFIVNNMKIENVLISDSTLIGNYYNNLWNITNSKAKYSIDYGVSYTLCPYKKTVNSNVLLTTGADKSFSLLNIYDLAGNVWEWTLEKATDENNTCVRRGGYSFNNGTERPVNYRAYDNIEYSNHHIGFRVSIY